MTPDPKSFVADWQAAWNSYDMPRLMAHFRPDIVYRSPQAETICGNGEVRGIQALTAYWCATLERDPDQEVEVLDVFTGFETIVIVWRDRGGPPVAESFHFDENGAIDVAAACPRTGPIDARPGIPLGSMATPQAATRLPA
ncbi:nuclear transport factor 2 family protein [Wenxinia saemankumensis]|uniref:SnoaL-like domain-containing protein n=1 Tax=Wenxinia saemankumensis TaxID=1447782 RepID=A0A1M6G9C9_9RHOB|nr:nuclear transport factor 2 family protein [Wenxinia saemankumensis]SHJ06528.1 SnoaL-like domain-containing protein [Wenxinia saemankumensis]